MTSLDDQRLVKNFVRGRWDSTHKLAGVSESQVLNPSRGQYTEKQTSQEEFQKSRDEVRKQGSNPTRWTVEKRWKKSCEQQGSEEDKTTRRKLCSTDAQ